MIKYKKPPAPGFDPVELGQVAFVEATKQLLWNKNKNLLIKSKSLSLPDHLPLGVLGHRMPWGNLLLS
jgi:hypothetical protein